MSSFLEYIFHQQFGRGPWSCPYCESRHFSVRPAKDGKPVKFKCFKCESWGDEWDLLKLMFPRENYADRQERRAALYAVYLRDEQPSESTETHFPRGRMENRKMATEAFSNEADGAIKRLVAEFTEDELGRVQTLLELCAEFSLHPAALAGRVSFEIWSRKLDAEHMATCNDPDCECVCCRRVRGWTEQQIKEGCEQAQTRGSGGTPPSGRESRADALEDQREPETVSVKKCQKHQVKRIAKS